nr:pre-mRNA-splicing factor SLU7-like [Tanacetum cinerariifolium]
MKVNCVYSLDGWVESEEDSVGIQENKSLAQAEATMTATYLINRLWEGVEFEVKLQGSRVKPTMDPHTGENPDDMLIACKSKSEIEYTKGLLRKEFDMKELGPARKILGMEIVKDRGLVYGRDQGKHVDVDGFMDAVYAKDPDRGRPITRSVVVNCDNQSVIQLSRNAMFHERTMHLNVRYHFIKEIVESKEIEVAKIGMKDNAADAFTKWRSNPVRIIENRWSWKKPVKLGLHQYRAMKHTRKTCMERPRKLGAKRTRKNIAPDEKIETFELDYVRKRDRVSDDEDNEDGLKVDEAKVYESKQMDFAKVEKRVRTTGGGSTETIRNPRIREDTAKYLLNLDVNSAHYDPKTRSMREDPLPDMDLNEKFYAGDNQNRLQKRKREENNERKRKYNVKWDDQVTVEA